MIPLSTTAAIMADASVEEVAIISPGDSDHSALKQRCGMNGAVRGVVNAPHAFLVMWVTSIENRREPALRRKESRMGRSRWWRSVHQGGSEVLYYPWHCAWACEVCEGRHDCTAKRVYVLYYHARHRHAPHDMMAPKQSAMFAMKKPKSEIEELYVFPSWSCP